MGNKYLRLLFIPMALLCIACSPKDENLTEGEKTTIPIKNTKNMQVTDVSNSGCMTRSVSEPNQESKTIVLKKENDILSCELRNFPSFCFTPDFDINSNIITTQEATDSLIINVAPAKTDKEVTTCLCPFNISFSVRNIAFDEFYLSCWWFNGVVSFKNRSTLVLEDTSYANNNSESTQKDVTPYVHMLDGVAKWYYYWVFNVEEYNTANEYGKYRYEWFSEYAAYDSTTINGKLYRKIYQRSYNVIAPPLGSISGGAYVMGLREENGKVLVNYEEYINYLKRLDYEHTEAYYKELAEQMGKDIKLKDGKTMETDNWVEGGDVNYIPYPLTDDGEMVLYDFTMQVGDKFRSVAGHDDISVIKVGTVTTVGNIERRKLTLSNGLVLIEGVGCINSPSRLFTYLNPLPRNSQTINEFRGYYVGEECMYSVNSQQ